MAKVIAIEIDIKGQKQVLKLTDAIKQTNKQLKETQKEIDGANTASERLAKQKAYDQLTAQLVRLKAELKGARQEQNNAIRDFEAAKTGVGSYRSLNAELVKTRQAFKELSKAEREGAKGKDLINNIQRLDKELKKIDGSIGQFQRNVGNYEKGMLKLGSSITKVFLGRSLVDGLRRVTGYLGEVIERNKETNSSIGELDGAFKKVSRAVEGAAVSVLSFVAKPVSYMLNGLANVVDAMTGTAATTKEFSANTDQLQGKLNAVNKEFAKETAESNKLFISLQSSNTKQEEKKNLIDQINKQYGQYLPNLLTEKSTLNEIAEAQTAVNAALTKSFTLKLQQTALEDTVTAKVEEQVRLFDALRNQIKGIGPGDLGNFQQVIGILESGTDQASALRSVFTGYEWDLENNLEKLTGVSPELKEFIRTLKDAEDSYVTMAVELSDGSMVNSVDKLSYFITKAARTSSKFDKVINETLETTNKLSEGIVQGGASSTKSTTALLTEYEKLQKRVETATKALQEQAAKGQPTQKAIDELKQSTIELNAANEKVKAILDSLIPKKEEDTKATKEEAKAVKDLSGEIDQLNQKQQENASLSGIASGRLAVFEEARAQLRQIVGNEDDAAKQVEQIRQNLANRLQQLDRQTLEQQDQTIQAEIDNIEFQKAQELSVFEGSEQEKLLLAQQFNAQLSQLRLEQITTQQQIVAKDVANFKLGEDAKTKKAKEEGEKRKQLATQLVQGFQQVQAAFSQLSAVSAEQDIKRLDDLATKRQENITNLQSELQTASGLEAQFLQQKIQQETAAAEDIAKRKEALAKQENERKKESAIISAIINGAVAITQSFAQLGPIGGAIAAAIVGATTIAQIATISAQEFAGGGLVRNLSGKTGKIGGKGNIAPRANGDNVLATVKTDEVILNKTQQSLLGGANTFGSIGVPGFARGGRVSASLGSPSLGVSTGIGSAVEASRQLKAFEDRTEALEKVVFKSEVSLNTRKLDQDNKDKQVILKTIGNV